jgi:aminopeptidase
MADPRVERFAKLLIEYSTRIQPGDRVLIEAETPAEPLVRELYKRILEVGGHPHLDIKFPSLEATLLRLGNDAQLDYVPPFRMMAYENFESRIRIQSKSNTKDLQSADLSRLTRRRKALSPILQAQMRRGAAGEFRWLSTLFPTQAFAQDAEMSLAEYEDFVYGACYVNDPDTDPVDYWTSYRNDQKRIVEALKGHDHVELRGPNCELSLSIKGRKFLNACGEANMPDGEVFTGPVEDSAEGWVRFTYPAINQGRSVEGVELHFSKGRVVEAKAEVNEDFLLEMLDADEGARYLGEFAIGTNFAIQRFTSQILFDEKIGGTFHIAVGAGYPETGSKNKSSIHWDMICDIREESEIIMDGDVIYKNGSFQI